jgi:hypothetical protein
MSDEFEWDADKLGASYWIVQDSAQRQRWLPDTDPRITTITEALGDGQSAINDVLELSRDPQHLVTVIDELPDNILRLIVFERLWAEHRRRLGAPYWNPLP